MCAFDAFVHSMHLCIRCICAFDDFVHSMHLCIRRICAFDAFVHLMHLCIRRICAFDSFVHSMHLCIRRMCACSVVSPGARRQDQMKLTNQHGEVEQWFGAGKRGINFVFHVKVYNDI